GRHCCGDIVPTAYYLRAHPRAPLKTTRRDFLHFSAATAAALSTNLAFAGPATNANLYTTLLQSWCDGLLKHQVTDIADPALHGAFLCPSCAMIHGRC